MRAYLQIRNDIDGYGAVADTVRAVETVAASNIQRIRNATLSRSAYVEELRAILASFSRHFPLERGRLPRRASAGSRALLVLGGDRGMVGGLYNGLIGALAAARGNYDKVVVVGERVAKYAHEEGIAIDEVLPGIPDRAAREDTAPVSDRAIAEFQDGDWRQVDVLYARFSSLTVQAPGIDTFLPFTFSPAQAAEPETGQPLGLPIFRPSIGGVAEELLKRYAALFFHSIASEAKLSEFAARTVATENAAAKAEEQMGRSRLKYFKERRRDFSQKQIESFFAHRTL